LLPALADVGYRAVAPFNRGFAPTELPDDRHHVHTSMLVNDQIALHEALGGNEDAVIIAPMTGACAACQWLNARRRKADDASAARDFVTLLR
jgi:hypothetical protein